MENLPFKRDLSHLGDLEPRLLSYTCEDRSGCWTWQGTLTGSGQPALRLGPERKVQQVRRWVFEATYGTIPNGRRALAGDGCRPRCVHPDHTLVLPEGVRFRSQIKSRD
ncbi:hypothetical protein SAMN05421756_10915 [Microlunatus flavus]|uniref:HNH endonuclease n=1 Tax=Microlunatus flavus TaxID=1036181 RepID=A0A1H9LLT5_9ACTN|nr:hypothetical protein SAMN05421756_10915 [Microlunatus flavus]